jgi:DNA-binding winged helix-turn-helix (wHTH) protein/quercetin dioxygenase-like cupin family protein
MASANAPAYRFGDFTLNVGRGCLQRNGVDLELRPKAFELLLYLVERAGRLASKDELVEATWPNVTVSDDSLAQCVRDVRRLLDDEDQRFIKTVPRRGYVFVADVSVVDGEADATAAPLAARDRRHSRRRRLDVASFGLGIAAAAVLLAAWMGVTALVPADDVPEPPFALLHGNKTVLGQTIEYPAGTPLLRALILVSPPGAKLEWHQHKTPAFGYILEGEMTVDYGSKGVRVFRSGDAFLEALDWPHQISNSGTGPARVFALYIGSEGTDFSTPAAGPK